MIRHSQRVGLLCDQIQQAPGQIRRTRTKTVCSVRAAPADGRTHTMVNTSDLTAILEVDVDAKQIVIEPGVTMEQLVREMRPYGFYPPVLTEFRHMSWGGAVIGLGGESSSIHHGFLHESVLEYEVIDGKGDVRVVTRETSEGAVWNAIPGSYGALGLVTSIRIQCVDRKPLVKCVYEWHHDAESLIKWWSEKDWEGVDFVDAIAVSSTKFCAIYGIEADPASLTTKECWTQSPSFASDSSMWYYNHVLNKQSGETEYLTFEDYVFRWDRGAFFNASMRMEPTLWNRWMYGSHLSTKKLYERARRKTVIERESRKMNQDMMVPITKLWDFLKKNDATHRSYPMWLLPMRSKHDDGLFTFPLKDALYVDVGTYGYSEKQPFDFVQENRALERALRVDKGIKCLWNQGYYTENEFWDSYDKTLYDTAREKMFAANRFQDVWRKTCALAAKWNEAVDLGDAHHQRVNRVVEAVKARRKDDTLTLERRKLNYTMHHNEYKEGTHRVDVHDFDHVLDVNPLTKRVWVEPGVTTESLYGACIKANLIPLVLPELKQLTVGGLISGAGLESSSFRHGQFNDTCTTMDVVLGNGELRRCTRDQHPTIFHGVAGAFGSLGIVTAVELQCRSAAPKVTLEYHRFRSTEAAMDAVRKAAADATVDFVEGIALDASTTALILGRLDSAHAKMPQLDLKPWNAPWFTEHVEDVVRERASFIEQMDLEQYLFRHDRGGFWTGIYAHTPSMGGLLPRINVGRMKNVRKVLSSWFDTNTLWSKLSSKDHTLREKRFVFQDIYVPIEETPKFVEECDTMLGIYPIWLCPVKTTDAPQHFNPHVSSTTDLVIDVGLYGVPTRMASPFDGIQLNRRLEELMMRTKSLKMFYGRAYYTRSEWNQVYKAGIQAHDDLRRETGADEAFVHITKKLRIPET